MVSFASLLISNLSIIQKLTSIIIHYQMINTYLYSELPWNKSSHIHQQPWQNKKHTSYQSDHFLPL